jgi:hypothetical protein
MREREEVLSEYVKATHPHQYLRDRVHELLADEIVRLREALAAETRVVEASKRVIDADTDVLQAVAIVMLREAFAAETQGESNA